MYDLEKSEISEIKLWVSYLEDIGETARTISRLEEVASINDVIFNQPRYFMRISYLALEITPETYKALKGYL